MSESEERDCCRIDASILQHKRAYCQLQSRFSRINHRDGHFREESRAKVTVLTCKRGRAGVLQACILHYKPCSTRYKLVKQAARRLPCGRDARLWRRPQAAAPVATTAAAPSLIAERLEMPTAPPPPPPPSPPPPPLPDSRLPHEAPDGGAGPGPARSAYRAARTQARSRL
jgi:hypothetical protein